MEDRSGSKTMKTGKKIFGSIESLLVLALLFVSIFSVTPVSAQESVWAEIQTAGLNVREGPGVTYISLGALSRGDESAGLYFSRGG